MKYSKFYLYVIAALSLTLFACSELKNDIAEPVSISVHGSTAMQKASPTFHGLLLPTKKMTDCGQCHSQNYSGGTAMVSCASAQCHPTITVHTENIMNPSSAGFHGKYIANLSYNMDQCKQCHGATYSGGVSSPTCKPCHKQTMGPEACNTCHGDFSNPTLIAPPRSLNNAINTSDPSVGAHTKHLIDAGFSSTVACSECHKVPGGLKSAGHIDNTPRAEIFFGTIASSGSTAPSYNTSTYKCDNTYCHGGFSFSKANSEYQFVYTADKITGNNYKPVWNKVDGSETKCGTCHGLPPTGHTSSTLKGCATCHIGVVDEYGKIIDKTKHINGKIDVFGR